MSLGQFYSICIIRSLVLAYMQQAWFLSLPNFILKNHMTFNKNYILKNHPYNRITIHFFEIPNLDCSLVSQILKCLFINLSLLYLVNCLYRMTLFYEIFCCSHLSLSLSYIWWVYMTLIKYKAKYTLKKFHVAIVELSLGT